MGKAGAKNILFLPYNFDKMSPEGHDFTEPWPFFCKTLWQ